MTDALQNIARRLIVTDLDVINNVIYDFPKFEEPPNEYPLTRRDIGAIVSIESYARDNPRAQRSARLSLPDSSPFIQYLTPVFHTSLNLDTARHDLFVHETDGPTIGIRAGFLAETLDAAHELLSAMDPNKKLVVHCVHGLHRSPALALAIMVNEWPDAPAVDALRVLAQDVCLNSPKLREGELAFVDAYFGRQGALISAWQELRIHHPFNFPKAHECLERFNGILGPSRSADGRAQADFKLKPAP